MKLYGGAHHPPVVQQPARGRQAWGEVDAPAAGRVHGNYDGRNILGPVGEMHPRPLVRLFDRDDRSA